MTSREKLESFQIIIIQTLLHFMGLYQMKLEFMSVLIKKDRCIYHSSLMQIVTFLGQPYLKFELLCGSLDCHRKLIIAMDVVFGMEDQHLKNIVHFDLKCDNLLVNMRDPQRRTHLQGFEDETGDPSLLCQVYEPVQQNANSTTCPPPTVSLLDCQANPYRFLFVSPGCLVFVLLL